MLDHILLSNNINHINFMIISYRSEGLGWLQITSRVGAALAPWVAQWLKVYHIVLPFAIMGASAFGSSVLLIYMPETKGMKTPETLENKSSVKPEKAEFEMEDVPANNRDSLNQIIA